MMFLCPYCGFTLPKALVNGISSCSNCDRSFDSSPFNRILSSGWFARKYKIWEIERIKSDCHLTDDEAEIVSRYVCDEILSHEELRKILKQENISSEII